MDFGSFMRNQKTFGSGAPGVRGRGRGMPATYDECADPAPSRNLGHERGNYGKRGRGFNRGYVQPRNGNFVRGKRSRGHQLQNSHNYQHNNAYYDMQYGNNFGYSEDQFQGSGEQYAGGDYEDPNLNTNDRSHYKNPEGDFAQYGGQHRGNVGQWGNRYGDNHSQFVLQYGENENQFGDGEVQKRVQHGSIEGRYTMGAEEKLKNSDQCFADDFQNSSNKVQPTVSEQEQGDKTVNNQEVNEEECEEDQENSDEEKDETAKAIEKLPVRHNRGLMSTLIGLAGPEIQNRKPDPLPRPQPMKLVDDNTLYLSTNKKSVSKIDDATLLEYGITQKMLDEANIEIDDTPVHERDLLPNEIGKELNQEFFCKLCNVQTTSMGNFRDHLNGKGHKATFEAFKLGKKPPSKKKKTAVISSEVLGKKSVSLEMVEDALEPILGLSYITEYHSQSGIINVCNLCGVKFDRNIVVSHVTGTKHRLHYMRENRPSVYIHLKKFGGKKSQLSAFLDELSLDAEREDGRGIPSIKVFEQPDHIDEEDGSVNELLDEADDEETKEKKQKEAMLARRKPGNISFQDWVNEEIIKAKSNIAEKSSTEKGNNCDEENSSNFKFGAGSSGPPVNKGGAVHQPHLLHPDLQIKPKFQKAPISPLMHNLPRHPHHLTHFSRVDDHLPHRYGPEPFLPRPDPYFDPLFNPYRSDAHLYHDRPLPPPSSRNPPYLDFDQLKLSLGRGYPPVDPYFDPNPLKRVRNYEPYLDPDPTKRVRNSEHYLDPDPTKRVRNLEPYLDPDPTKRVRISETYLDPDPLKRIPPKKTVPTPVVFDYCHGSSGKNDTTPHRSFVQKTADSWEDDIQQILGADTKAPNSLAILSSNYSSPESSPPPATEKKTRITDKPLPFSRSYLDTHLPPNILKDTRPKKLEKTSDYKSGLQSSSFNKGNVEKDLNDLKHSTSQDHHSRHKSEYLSHVHDKNRRSRTPDHLRSSLSKSSTIINTKAHPHKYSVSPKQTSKRRYSVSPDNGPSKASRGPSASYFSNSTDRSRMSPVSKNHQKSFDSQSLVGTQTDSNKTMQDIFSEADEDEQAERIANLLLQMSGSLSEEGDAQSALRKLFANSDLTKALFAAKANSDEQKHSSSQEKLASPSQSQRQTKDNASSNTSQIQPPPRRDKVTFSLPVTSRGQSFRSTLPSDFAADEDTE